MSEQQTNADSRSTEPVADEAAQEELRKSTASSNSGEPDVPAGNMPPVPRWPLFLFGAVWLGWLGFLATMMVQGRS